MNSLKSLAMNCGLLSGIRRPRLGMLLLGRFENDFDVGLPHPLAQIPVHNRNG